MEKVNGTFDGIMSEITSGLTGDLSADLSYLEAQCDKYKNHEFSQEIARACGRLIYDLIPDDKKADFMQALNNDSAGIEASLDEARFNIYKHDYAKALKIMDVLVGNIEEMKSFQDDKVSEYRIFNEPFEKVLYCHKEKTKKDIRPVPSIPYTEIYLLYGSLMIELKRYDDARAALKKALHWNPVHFRVMSEYMETYKVTGDLEKFFSLTLEAFKIAFHAPDIARCHRNLGYYFVEKDLYQEAIACYQLSAEFGKSQQVQSELSYISAKTNGKITAPTIEDVKGYAEKYGFPVGADDDVLGLAVSCASASLENGEKDAARYFFSIAYEMTTSPYVKGMLDRLS